MRTYQLARASTISRTLPQGAGGAKIVAVLCVSRPLDMAFARPEGPVLFHSKGLFAPSDHHHNQRQQDLEDRFPVLH